MNKAGLFQNKAGLSQKMSKKNTKNKTIIKKTMNWVMAAIIACGITVLTAALTALGTTSCMGYGPF